MRRKRAHVLAVSGIFRPAFKARSAWPHMCVHLSSRLRNYSRQLLDVSSVINAKRNAHYCKLRVILQAVQEQHQQARICGAAAGGRGGRAGAGARRVGGALERSGGAGGGLGGCLPAQALWLTLHGWRLEQRRSWPRLSGCPPKRVLWLTLVGEGSSSHYHRKFLRLRATR